MSDFSAQIKKIEDLSLNAWPSHQIQFYDGWVLRFSYFYTHRTNCVEQIGNAVLPPESKIPECEAVYRRWNTPAIFKITPYGDPDLDHLLEQRGYRIEHHTTVMTADLSCLPETDDTDTGLTLESRVSDSWLCGLFRLKKTVNPDHLRVVPQMYNAIPKDEIAVSMRSGDTGEIMATGLGILDRDFVGVYAIFVDPALRRRGIGERIVRTILERAKKSGAKYAYLQVVTDNSRAKTLYRKIGFTECYRYWFRVKEV